MKKWYVTLVVLHAFIGIGAVFGGLGAVIDPSGEPMGISTDILKNGPFNDFFIPGLFLLLVNGLGNIITAILAHKRYRFIGYISGVFGVIMMMWIVIQCYMLDAIHILHVIFFVLGLVVASIALVISLKQRLFPLNYFIKEKS